MNIVDRNSVISILKKDKFWAKKSCGQNFLVDKKVLDKVIKAANLSSSDSVLEIGPGLGVLTEELAQKAKLVLTIEKDYKLVEWLRKYFKGRKNVKIIHGDVLTYDLQTIDCIYKVVANLPYNITSPVIRKLLESKNRPSEMILMMQKEVANRLTAKPGSSDRGILTVMIELYGSAEIIDYVNGKSFFPIPDVDSAIIKIVVEEADKSINDPASFMRLVKIGFSQKRRQIHHPLASGLHLSRPEILDILKKAEIMPNLRAEDLKIENWIKLYNKILEFQALNNK
jgi:16S rRNA (adenine1518-N6/adenine1519-N6)-dimethyltransferase